MNRLFLLFLCASLGVHAAEPALRQASEGRFWLKVPASQTPLRDVEVSTGSANTASWEKDAAVRERHLDVTFPVRWWNWKKITVSFTPVEDGTVDLVLLGPWEEKAPGELFRKDVLWDEISALGATVSNGGFESVTDGKPDDWTAIYGNPLAPAEWPLEGAAALKGKAVAASWQNRPLAQTFKITAGRRVTLELHARAATIPGFAVPKLFGSDTPAHRAAASIKRGVNLGNCWEAPPPYSWGVRYFPEDIDHIADEGFDHIRVPVAWHHHLVESPDGLRIDPALLADLEPVLRRAVDRKLKILLDWHHFNDLTDNPAANRAKFIAGWETVARHFKTWPQELFLELLNEPRDQLTTEVANPIYADTISAIRRIDSRRIIFVSPGKWGDPRELENLRLPDGDDRLVATVHCYEPFPFTHQGANWVQLEALKGIVYPGPPATPFVLPASLEGNAGIRAFVEGYNTLPTARNPCSATAVGALLDLSREWSAHFGRPVHLGEFGSHDTGDAQSRARYSKDVRLLAESRGIPWTLWDWKAGFRYWDGETKKPLLKAALFE